jgi:hypothetical protein
LNQNIPGFISKTANYKEGQLTRFVSVKYKSDLRRDGNDYLGKNAEQEVVMKPPH